MKKHGLALLTTGLAVSTLALSGCGSGGASDQSSFAESAEPSGDKPYVAIVSMGFQQEFWQAVKRGAEEAAEEYDVEITYEGPDNETKVEQQMQQLTAVLGKNPDAIALAALDAKAPGSLLQQAHDKGIPVIAFDSGVDSDVPATTVKTDSYGAAAEAAKHMAEALDHEGQVGLIGHSQTDVTAIERRDGFIEYMEQNEPNIEIVDVQYGAGNPSKSADLAKAIISAYPDVKGLYATNEGSAVGLVQAVKELGIDPGAIALVGFDSGHAQVQAIRDGLMLGAVSQDPIAIGYETVKAAVQALEGEELPKEVWTGFYWYDESNVDDEEIKAVLYE